MAPPPAKRPKRLIASSSDDGDRKDAPRAEEHIRQAQSNAKPSLNGSTKRALPTRDRPNPRSTTIQPKKDPPPKRSKHSAKETAKSKRSKDISWFFSSTNHAQEALSRPPQATLPEVTDEVEDLIEDDSSNEAIEEIRETCSTAKKTLDRRKQAHGDQIPKASQQFKMVDTTKKTTADVPIHSRHLDARPWSERFGPTDLEELVVHKKKVSDVRSWLNDALHGLGFKSILILKGPSGSGKTATVSTLSRAMGFEISEWRNPVGSEYSSEGYLSMSAQFSEFLGRSGRFAGLDLSNRENDIPDPSNSQQLESNPGRKVILLEEYPSAFLSVSSALRSFRLTILEYLAMNTPTSGFRLQTKHPANITPLIMIITETRMTSTISARDSFTAHRLLGPEVLSHPGVSVIDFNPIASTLLTKALNIVIQKEARQSGRRRVPELPVLQALGETGDVRSAIGSLEFLCLRGGDGDDWGGRVASKAKKGAKTSSVITKLEKASLEMVSQRESSLGLFHAVGKVVYNKRDDTDEVLAQPPSHLRHHVRTRVPQVSVDLLFDETGTDTDTFIAALHENYVLSCEGTSVVDTVNHCLDYLSDSDILGSSMRDFASRSYSGATSDVLRQDEICFQLAVRGLLFALPDPVRRQSHPGAGKHGEKNDTYKMFYPTSMRLSKQVEEITGLVEVLIQRYRIAFAPFSQPTSTRGHQFAKSKPKAHPTTEDSSQSADEEERESFRTCLNCTKEEMVLERLPYMTKIDQRNPMSSSVRELERITQFQGIQNPADDSSDDEAANQCPLVADRLTNIPSNQKPGSAASLLQGRGSRKRDDGSTTLPVEEEVEKAYLSDDDIED